GGVVVVCMALNKAYLTNSSAKLGLGLALAPTEGAIITTPGFPSRGVSQARSESTMVADGSKTWAVARFEPKDIPGAGGRLAVVAALDVTDVNNIIHKNLLFALLVLLFAAVVSVALGARLASIMGIALSRVNAALKKLAIQEYVHVDAVKTGDELEDLAA